MGERISTLRDKLVSKSQEILISLSPEGMLVAGFGVLIFLGTPLLLLPWANRGDVGFLDALFTATSAVCVTGLAVVDTATDYTTFGQVVILLLIQAGGIGIMSFAALAFRLLGRRMSLRAQAALSGAMLQQEVGSEFRGLFRGIVGFVIIAEAVGALLIFIGLLPADDVGHAAYSAVFHSVSAFCNAGFSIYSDSLMGLRDNTLVLWTVMLLIVLGGIGHPVVVDVWRRFTHRRGGPARRLHRLSLNSKVALWSSVILVFGGFVLILLLGIAPGLTPGERTGSDELMGALFQSVTSRTAGFNTVDIGALPLASLFVMMMLMFVGGSPGSCAGGIKTTTITLWLAKLWSRLRGDKSPRLFGRHVRGEFTRRVSMIIGIAAVWNLVGILLLLATEGSTPGVTMQDVLFEQISAFGTVGLSTGLTVKLSVVGRLWIIVTMFVGRLGPLTLALSVFTRKMPAVRYPEGRIMIG